MPKRNLYEKFMNVDRRIIYLVIGILVLIPLFVPLNLPTDYTQPVLNIYDYIENISHKKNPVVMISFNYGGSTLAELEPMARSLIKHCYLRNVKVLGFCWTMQGEGLSEKLFAELSDEYGKKSGVDYVNFGFRTPVVPILLGMGTNLHQVLPKDVHNVPISELPMMKNIKTYQDIDLVIELCSAATYGAWITYARGKFGQDLAAGVTAVMAAEMYPYLDSGQMKGLLPGLKGGAEYEKLVDNLAKQIGKEQYGDEHYWEKKRQKNLKLAIKKNNPDATAETLKKTFETEWQQSVVNASKARVGMDSQAVAHIAIIIFVVMGNIGYFMSEKQKKRL